VGEADRPVAVPVSCVLSCSSAALMASPRVPMAAAAWWWGRHREPKRREWGGAAGGGDHCYWCRDARAPTALPSAWQLQLW